MTDPLARSIADRLLIGSLEGAIVIALVWVVCRRVSTIPPAARAGLWWLASLNLVFALLPVPAVTLPILPAPDSSGEMTRDAVGIVDSASARVGRPFTGRHPGGAEAPPYTSSASREFPDWYEAAVLVWLVVFAAQAGVLLRRFRQICALTGRAEPCSAGDAAGAAAIAHLIGLRRLPEVRTSTEIDAPQMTGVWRPVVLLPARDFTSEERRMMLCHELMHIRRRDLALGWVPAVAERLFFFHPLARFAAREYVAARESACDAAVLHALGVLPADYGRLLIRFGVGAPEPALTAGGSPTSRSSLRRRLEMLHDAPTARASRRASWVAAGAVAALVPLQLAARAPQSPAPPAPAAPSVAAAPVAPEPVTARPAPAAAPPSEPAPAAPAVAEPRPEIEAMLRLMELRSQQQSDPEAIRRQSEQAARMIGARQDAAEQRRREQEMDRVLRELSEEYLQRLRERQVRTDAEAARASLEQLARETRGLPREQEVAEREIATAAVRGQLEQLKLQQDVLLRQLERIAEQQQQLSAAQQQLRDETERIRKRLEAGQ
jgi:beta-lactamase regulating signal transducer with metallopeptidase domain